MPRSSEKRCWPFVRLGLFAAFPRRAMLALVIPAVLALVAAPARADENNFWVPDLFGATGLINTPTAYVIPEGSILFGISVTQKKWAYYVRGVSDNWNYGFVVGFLPRVELNLRITYVPDAAIFKDFNPGIQDRGGGGRIQVLREGRLAPAVAVGMDDVRGTKRFHSLYAVGTKEISVTRNAVFRATLGYGSDALKGKHPVILNAYFGGGELILDHTVSLAVDNDTEKWNAALRANVFGHLSLSYALLDFDIPAGSVAWFQRF